MNHCKDSTDTTAQWYDSYDQIMQAVSIAGWMGLTITEAQALGQEMKRTQASMSSRRTASRPTVQPQND